MKQILFVDDEGQVLDGLRASLRKKRTEWDMSFAESGEAALARLRSRPFDVIVSDMRMPGMDGAELLSKVRAEFPNVIRIILSGHSERESVMRALPVCHQFLAKPCDGPVLRDVIERACGLHRLLESEALRRVVGSTEKLPSLPRVYWALTQAMSNPNVSPKEIAQLVHQDPAMCAKLLQLVNSSYFGLARRVASVEQAIVYLGFELVRNLSITAHIFSAAEAMPAVAGLSFESLQEHGVLTAAVARKIAPDARSADDAFTAGLLHDVGKVILTTAVPDRVAELIALSRKSGQPMHVTELQVLGVTHAEVGAYLLGLWGLPVPIVEAVAYHHDPTSVPHTTLDSLAIVHIADALVAGQFPSVAGAAPAPALDMAYLEALGVAGELPRWSALASAIVNARDAKRAGGR
jgi:HD-like signal output (HDOD) protein